MNKIGLTDKSGREYQVAADDGFTDGHDVVDVSKKGESRSNFCVNKEGGKKLLVDVELHLKIGFEFLPNAQQKRRTNPLKKKQKSISKKGRNGVLVLAERCCSAGARESSYPATDGEATENVR
jgi:hypothetical protein